MLTEIKSSFRRCAPTLLPDMAGVTALVVLLLAALHLPALV